MRGREPTLTDPDDLESLRVVSFQRAAELMDVSYMTVSRLVAAGELRTALVASKRRIPVTELRAYLDRQAARASLHPRRAGRAAPAGDALAGDARAPPAGAPRRRGRRRG